MNDFEKQMMQKAAGIMSDYPDLEEQSRIREKYKFQEENPFWDEEGISLSENDIERRSCTKKEKDDLDKSIEQLGDLFSDADFYWQLDGALNISLYKGEYIGVHKDIDLSIDFRDLEKIEPFLNQKGFGLFLSSGRRLGKKRVFERINARRLQDNSKGLQPMILAIDANGAIKYGEDGFGIDTHIIEWDKNEKPLARHTTPIPKEWLNPKIIDFHGRKINCSNPALTTFHKLFFNRAYDDNDLKLLAQSGELTHGDVNLIEQTFNKYIDDIQKMLNEYVGRIFSQISDQSSKQQIFDVMINDELVSKRKDDAEIQKEFDDLSEKIAAIKERKKENIYKIIAATTPIDKLASKKEARFAMLRDNIPAK